MLIEDKFADILEKNIKFFVNGNKQKLEDELLTIEGFVIKARNFENVEDLNNRSLLKEDPAGITRRNNITKQQFSTVVDAYRKITNDYFNSNHFTDDEEKDNWEKACNKMAIVENAICNLGAKMVYDNPITAITTKAAVNNSKSRQ